MNLKGLSESITEFHNWNHPEKIRFFSWYLHKYSKKQRLSTSDINDCYNLLHLEKPSNTSAYINSLKTKKPKEILQDKNGFYLEKKIYDRFDSKFGHRQTTVLVHQILNDLYVNVPDLAEREFLSESIKCLKADSPRAAIIMCWNLTFDHLCNYILINHLQIFNSCYQTKYAKLFAKYDSKQIVVKDDFLQLKESEVIEICNSSNIVNSNIHKILKEKLSRRNIAAHPNGIKFEIVQAEDFISDLINNVVVILK